MIRRVFKWGTLLDYVDAFTSYELTLVLDILEEDKRCRVNPPRKNVPKEHIEAVVPYLPKMYAAILLIIYWAALRPCEACGLRSCDIIFEWENGTWLYAPKNHKTAHHGKEKPSIFDKECQGILKKYLPEDRTSELPIFMNQHGKAVNPNEFGRIIKRAIDTHGLPKFTPY